MPTALILEIEELLFDTRAIRAGALHDALQQEGVSIAPMTVVTAHAGVPAAVALQRLASVHDLDATGRDLVLLRAMETASRIFLAQAPSFKAESRDALLVLHAEFALGVVTRATGAEALRWLEAAGLEASIATVRSLSALDPSEYVASWADALRRTHATHGVAIAAPAMLGDAGRAGLRTVQIGSDPDPSVDGYHPDVRLETLFQVQAALLATRSR